MIADITFRSVTAHCDVQDLKDVTSQVHYEKYRCEKLTALAAGKEVSHLPLHRFLTLDCLIFI